MRVTFEERELEKLCDDEAYAKKKRADVATAIGRRRLALENADTVGDLETVDPKGYWHQLTGNLAGLWAGKLNKNWRLLIRPAQVDEPWDAEEVSIVAIDDYHKK